MTNSGHVLRMSVSDAVDRRISVRAFLAEPVSGDLVRTLLHKASRAPSGGNVQPWHVHALAGAALEELKAAMAAKIEAAQSMREMGAEPTDYDIYPADLWSPHGDWRAQCGEDMYATIGVERIDKAGRLAHLKRNFQFFDAPVGLFFTLDRRMGPPQWSDLGMFMQTFMLLAVEAGLGTCAQEAWSLYPATVARIAGIPDNELIFAGMAVGYPDRAAAINTLRTARAGPDEFARLRGFD